MAPTSTWTIPRDDRYLDDYVQGAVFECSPITVEEAEVLSFATRFDPQAIHIDAEKAARGPFHGLIASGWHTLGLMMRMFVDNYLSSVASVASPGVDEVRWLHPVRPGDQLHLRVTILEVKPSRSKPDRGVVVSLLEAINQDGKVVCSLKAMNLLLRRPGV
jgi:acyl dehydratase